MPVLDGRAVLYSFVSVPEVRIGVAFGSGGSQSLPATELPGVSSWLVRFLTFYFCIQIWKYVIVFTLNSLYFNLICLSDFHHKKLSKLICCMFRKI